jgi:hypothetical protein
VAIVPSPRMSQFLIPLFIRLVVNECIFFWGGGGYRQAKMAQMSGAAGIIIGDPTTGDDLYAMYASPNDAKGIVIPVVTVKSSDLLTLQHLVDGSSYGNGNDHHGSYIIVHIDERGEKQSSSLSSGEQINDSHSSAVLFGYLGAFAAVFG